MPCTQPRKTPAGAHYDERCMASAPDTPSAVAALRFEHYLATHGESVCLASLPFTIDEIATEVAAGDPELYERVVAQLRQRAGLHV